LRPGGPGTGENASGNHGALDIRLGYLFHDLY
jgi:hypothetical protein